MANADRPSGFMPRRHAFGGVIRANPYKIDSEYATGLFTGDAVILSSGYVAIAADDSSVLLGVFAGCQYRATDGEIKFSKHWPASTATLGGEDPICWVWDDPGIVYAAQTDTGTAYVDATHKGGVFDVELDHTGNTTTGQSGMEIDLNDTGTGQFLVLGLIDEPGNAAGVNAKVEVKVAISLVQGS